MMTPHDPNQHPPGPELPGPLADDLRRVYGRASRVDERVDRAVLGAVERAGRRRPRLGLAWPAVGASSAGGLLAAAAGIAMLVVAGVLFTKNPPAQQQAQQKQMGRGGLPRYTNTPADTNGDGVVDVLDVFRLARAVHAGAATRDFNNDGISDMGDVDALAARIVRVIRPSEGQG